jgi:hypothetical protein
MQHVLVLRDFERKGHRTVPEAILSNDFGEECEWSDGIDVFVITSGISASCARQGRVFCRAGDIDKVFAMV